jgi:3-oxoacyl-[acyl-carrier protein] reductase
MSDKQFAGRTALVTGGSRGIGRAISLMLGAEGARVAVNYQQNRASADETVEAIKAAGGEGIALQADVSQADAVKGMVDQIRQAYGPVELLVNNAGIASTDSHAEFGFDLWKRMFEVNVDGPFLTTWAVKDEMVERQWGRIVNIASLAGIIIKKNMIHYATTKAALISFTRHCAEALAPHNIRVNCVAPGLTDTELARSANPGAVQEIIDRTPLGRMAAPEEMARTVRFMLSDDSSFVTGQTLLACGGRA